MTSSRLLTSSLLPLAAVLAPATARAQTGVPTGVVAGRVVEAGTAQPLPGATVRLAPVGAEGAGRTVTAGTDGRFALAGLAPGRYLAVITALGYAPACDSFDVRAGATARLAPALARRAAELAPVVVAGERVRRGLSQTFGSVAVVGADALRDAGIDRLEEAFRLTANARDADFVDAGIVIRGVNSEGVGGPAGSPLATVYVDGVAQTRNGARRGALGAWDLRQVEVWRGPQSTLSGRNALAGKVELLSNDPSMRWEAAVQGEAGSFARQQQAALVSGPLVADRLAFRVSAERRRAAGQVDYPLYAGFPKLRERAEDDYRQARAKLLWTPRGESGPRALLSASSTYDSPSYADVDGASAQAAVGPGGPAEGAVAGALDYGRRVWGLQTLPAFVEARSTRNDQGSLELSWPLADAWTVTALGTLLRTDTRRPSVDLATDGRIDERERAGELRTAYTGRRLEGVVGLYTLDGDFTDDRDQRRPGEAFVRQDRRAGGFTNLAAYGEARWRVRPRWTLVAGGRYDRERQDFANAARRVDAATGAVGRATGDTADATFAAFLPKAGLTFDLGGGSTLGLTAQRAYRAGGAALNAVTGQPYRFRPEYAWNYELAWRGAVRAADGGERLRYGVNAFRLDWHDQQLNIPQVPGDFTSDVILNAGRSTVTGGEAELAGRVAGGLTAFGSLGVAATRFERFRFVQFGQELNFAGEPFPQAPRASGVLGAEYRAGDGPLRGAFLGGDANFASAALSRSLLEGGPRDRLPGYGLVNLRAGWRGAALGLNRLAITGYVENAGDRTVFRYRYDDPQSQVATLGSRRVAGVIVRVDR